MATSPPRHPQTADASPTWESPQHRRTVYTVLAIDASQMVLPSSAIVDLKIPTMLLRSSRVLTR